MDPAIPLIVRERFAPPPPPRTESAIVTISPKTYPDPGFAMVISGTPLESTTTSNVAPVPDLSEVLETPV